MPATNSVRKFDVMLEENDFDKVILAEGDSWFAYPGLWGGVGTRSNVINVLAENDDFLLFNTSSNGDEAVAMVSGEAKLSLMKRLSRQHFDVLLFSGGGNDIVGKFDFDFILKERSSGENWQDCLEHHRIELKLTQIELAYELLALMVAQYSRNPETQIVTHTYDICPPSPVGFKLFRAVEVMESWVWPHMKAKGFDDEDEQKAVITHLLTEFKKRVQHVASRHDNLTVVDTHGTVADDEWLNEIHPNPAGFRKVARKIEAAIRAL
ncbi:SGNH/GDSL hydrolase family protein [Aliagarivorans marinus]|uniref:SGNH/GDSL hydrolase family protein n=1 Tax=Aliagarivorans marinus TaxID=561965 RepID=UPI00040F4283|nr:SGNH/GDSL hydrolase family protein [Aliagarivorans marinus]